VARAASLLFTFSRDADLCNDVASLRTLLFFFFFAQLGCVFFILQLGLQSFCHRSVASCNLFVIAASPVRGRRPSNV